MSWGTDFTADIFLRNMTFQSKGMLEDAIEEKENDIKTIEAHIKMWACSTPKDIFTTTEVDSLLITIAGEVDDMLEWYRETLLILKDLRRYLEYVNENNIDLTQKHETD